MRFGVSDREPEQLICGCTPKVPCATGKFLFEKAWRSKRNRPTGLELHLRYALKRTEIERRRAARRAMQIEGASRP
jgi:hypothetical protein